jgi:hypothetical protein
MKYLPKFKWENLKEKFEYDRKVREERLKMSITQDKREQNFYIEKAEVSKKLKFIGDRKKKRDVKDDDKQDDKEDDDTYVDPVDKKRLKNVEKSIKYHQKHQRLYTQIEPKHKKEY